MGNCFFPCQESNFVSDKTFLETLQGKTLDGTFIRAYDGDTLTIQINFPPGASFRHQVRLLGLDCPEIRDKESRVAGELVRDFASAFCAKNHNLVRVHFADKQDKFGRSLGTVFVLNQNLNQRLLDLGFAKKFLGSGPKPTWSTSELFQIEKNARREIETLNVAALRV